MKKFHAIKNSVASRVTACMTRFAKDNRGEGYLDMAMKILIVVVIGASAFGIDTDLVQRIDGENTLVTDYLEMDEWRHNSYLCIWAVSQLVTHLDIRRQMDAHCITRPLEERLHIMRLRD